MARMVIVTNSPWNWGGMYGYRIEGYELQPFRMRDGKLFKDGQFRIQKGQLYGVTVPMGEGYRDVVNKIGLVYGYCKPYTKNYGKFIMSRAARRRGYRSTDESYNRRAGYKYRNGRVVSYS